MRCKQIMSKPAAYLTETDTIQRAAQLMVEHKIGFLPVCDDQRRVLGALTDRDIVLRVVARGGSLQNQISTVMSHHPISCVENDSISAARTLMYDKSVHRVICTDEKNHLRGVLTSKNVQKAFSRTNTTSYRKASQTQATSSIRSSEQV